jgi:uncharacterized membrane protein
LSNKQKRQKPSREKKLSNKKAQKKYKSIDAGKKIQKSKIKKWQHPNWYLVGLAAVGMALTGYLVLTGWFGKPVIYCADGSACDVVQQSRWGTFLSIPTALLGFVSYAMLLFIGVRIRNTISQWKSALVISMVGVGYSFYLFTVSVIQIEAVCVYCITSLIIMLSIFVLTVVQRPKVMAGFNFSTWMGQIAIFTIIFVGGMHLHYSGVFDPAAGPEDPYLKGLTDHLIQEKAMMYGAYW